MSGWRGAVGLLGGRLRHRGDWTNEAGARFDAAQMTQRLNEARDRTAAWVAETGEDEARRLARAQRLQSASERT